MNKQVKDLLVAFAGLALLGTGLLLIKAIAEPQGILVTLPYVCIGVGSGVFGSGMGSLISARAIRKNPDLQKQITIEQQDERNVAIANRAKAKAYDLMVFVFGALMLSYTLMQESTATVLLLVFSYLLVIIYGVYYRFKYDKEM